MHCGLATYRVRNYAMGACVGVVYTKVKVRTTEVDDDYECSVIPLQDFNSLSIRVFSPGIIFLVFSSSQEPHSGNRACKSLAVRAMAKEKERKQLSVAKVPRSYIPRSITPPPSLPKGWSLLFCVVAFTALLEILVSLTMATCAQLTAAKKSGQQTEDNVKSRTRASSIPRPRAVMSSPDNPQLKPQGTTKGLRGILPGGLEGACLYNDQILGNRDKMRLKRPSPLKNRNTAPCRPLAQSRSSPSTTTVSKPLKTTADSKETAHTSCNDRGNKGSAVDIRVPRAHIVKAKPFFTT
ncbi:hypothetical protein Cgig2_028776 [Carnegiea gigantea]|uniref:Uncharacterized protein n=1 Tax=Carnegiea gigantea TaxID=171969 RepID=A0A9Q1Q6R0_9CARY|nr:hypothetical protein Cgig2_028776 [Carnegiea gigantea]